MNLDPSYLAASFFVSGVGFVLWKYGRTQRRLPHAAMGVVFMVYPYFFSNVGAMLAMGGGLIGLLWLLTRLGM